MLVWLENHLIPEGNLASKEESMDSALTENLHLIKKNAQKLNSKADELTKTVMKLSKHLNSIQIGVSCYYLVKKSILKPTDNQGDLISYECFLGYDKDDSGQWGITVKCKLRETAADTASSTSWTKLFEKCPRDVRFDLIEYVPQVVEGLGKSIANITERIDSSLDKINKINNEIESALN